MRVKKTNKKPATLMLLDTYGLVYRAFFALPPLTTTKGVPINAAYGFTMMLNKLINDEAPTYLIACFDKGKPKSRTELFPQYKAQRTEMPDDLRPQFDLVREVLGVFNIPIVEVTGEEADDVIATLARQATAHELAAHTLVVTGDLDLLQIVNESVTALVTRRGIGEMTRYDIPAVEARFELHPSQLADYRGLKGDPSDNLPGIPGVGEKTAIKLMKAAGNLDALLADPKIAGTPKLQKLVEEHGEVARVCRDVSVIRQDLDIEIDWEHSRWEAPANADLFKLYRDLEFKTLLNKLPTPEELPPVANETPMTGTFKSYAEAAEDKDHPLLAEDPPEYQELAAEIERLATSSRLALALRDDELGISDDPSSGVSFKLSALDHEDVGKAFANLWKGKQTLIGYPSKNILAEMDRRGLGWRVFAEDPMVGGHLLNPSRNFANLPDAGGEFLALTVPLDTAAWAAAALQLVPAEHEKLQERHQLELYNDVEVPLSAVLAKMERAGITIDPSELTVMGKEIDEITARLQAQIYELAGEEFNIGSPQQLGVILFEKMGLPGGKKNKTGWGTGVEVLAALADENPICGALLEYREVTKLKNTYVDVIPKLTDKDKRLRTVFNQTITATGRLSSTNPNLQNIPVRGELGRRIRKAFVARDKDHVLLAADYSQIELRLMAHLSKDPSMVRAFQEFQDIHDFTGRQIFNVPDGEEVTNNQRRIAKSVNFGLLYGMSEFGLSQRLEISKAEAKEMTTAYFDRFPSVRDYIKSVLAKGKEDGYVSTLRGRRRYMPALRSSNYLQRSAAEREATNAPIQGSAADLMKVAMVNIDKVLSRNKNLHTQMLLQIHDELIFEVPRVELDEVAHIVRTEMEGAEKLDVPIEATLKIGSNWYDMETLKTTALSGGKS